MFIIYQKCYRPCVLAPVRYHEMIKVLNMQRTAKNGKRKGGRKHNRGCIEQVYLKLTAISEKTIQLFR